MFDLFSDMSTGARVALCVAVFVTIVAAYFFYLIGRAPTMDDAGNIIPETYEDYEDEEDEHRALAVKNCRTCNLEPVE